MPVERTASFADAENTGSRNSICPLGLNKVACVRKNNSYREKHEMKPLNWFGVVCGIALLLAFTMPVGAESPVAIAKVAEIGPLTAEVNAKIADLEKLLATEASYNDGKKNKLLTDAGSLAIVAQAVAEHADKDQYKGSAAAVSAAAVSLWKSENYADAQKALAAIKEGAEGKGTAAAGTVDWAKLSKLGSLMSEVNKRHGQLRRSTKSLPPDTADSVRSASVIAVLAIAAHEDTHEVSTDADKAQWKTYSLEMQAAATELAGVLKARDAAKAKEGFTKLNKSCSDCHDKYRKDA